MFKAHRLAYRSPLGWRVIKKKKNPCQASSASVGVADYSQVDMLSVCGTNSSTLSGKEPGIANMVRPNRLRQR